MDVNVRKLRNGKTAYKDETARGMVKGAVDSQIDWVCRLCNMTFKIIVVPEN